MELRGQATRETIAGFMAAVDAACAEAGADDESRYAVKLAVEEICLNVLDHGYRGAPGPLAVDYDCTAEGIRLAVIDSAPPFSPENAPPADLDSGWESREPGGYGWHLVRSMMDGLEHTATAGGNRVTVTKKFRKT